MYRLVPDRKDTFDRIQAEAGQLEGRVTLSMKSPWAGIMPDIAPQNHPANSCDVATRGLVPRPDPGGGGEVLMPDEGTTLAEASGSGDPLPLTSSNGLEVVGIGELSRTNATGVQTGEFSITPIAIVAGNGSDAGSRTAHRIDPTSSPRGWEVIEFDAGGAGLAAPNGNREALPDFAVLPDGAPGRGEYLGPIDQPVIVWCSLGDPVMVFPADAAGGPGKHKYSHLTDQFGAVFQAKTCEAYRSRMFFGHTSESGTIHRQRIRWTAPFTVDPQVSNPGSGALDIREFSRDLLRLEKLGDVLVAYFEDGTAFLRTTGNATAPLERQILKERRGLISTHSMVSVADNAHFGIFDDGWFLLDASGRWKELGIANIDGQAYTKWKRYFYDNLDITNRHRLYVSYDGNFIRIAYPRAGVTDIEEIWVYELRSDRLFITNRAAVCMSTVNQQISTELLWNQAVGTWSNIVGSWSSFRSRFGLRNHIIGQTDGNILVYDPDLITEFDTNTLQDVFPGFTFRTILSDLGQPRFLKTANKLWFEYINTNSTNVSTTVFGNADVGEETGTIDVSLTGRITGEVINGWRHTNFTDTHMGFQFTGNAPVLIRSMEADVFQRNWERRE